MTTDDSERLPTDRRGLHRDPFEANAPKLKLNKAPLPSVVFED